MRAAKQTRAAQRPGGRGAGALERGGAGICVQLHRIGVSARAPAADIEVETPFPMKRPALLTQVLAVNALLITATVFAASVAASLHPEPFIERKRFLVLVAALMAMVLLNGWLLRRRFAPLEELINAMERLDFGGRDTRSRIPTANVEEVARLHQAFDRMLERLEAERARTATAVLQAQEGERARLARDLHDEANQALTGVLLRLEATAQHAPPELRDELRETQGVATRAMGELVRLARELRPIALDDLGLGAALRTQVTEFRRRAGIETALVLPPAGLEDLDSDEQLVVYRVVQEGLSNVAQHAGARSVRVEVERHGDGTLVRVADDGDGFTDGDRTNGLGLTGMRERAVLAGGRLDVSSQPGAGTTIELRLGAAL
jgi:two-component system, NarL family, sensor histidine kinase UhpB